MYTMGNTPAVAMKHYLQVTDEHWRRAVMEETTSPQGGAESASKCASVPSGLGMNRVACSTSEKVVSVDSATVSTYTQERAGARDARKRTRTSTGFYSHQHLKLTRLPIPPLALGMWILAGQLRSRYRRMTQDARTELACPRNF